MVNETNDGKKEILFKCAQKNTHALRSKNGVLGIGVLESRPWVDHRLANVSLDQGRSGGRFIVAS